MDAGNDAEMLAEAAFGRAFRDGVLWLASLLLVALLPASLFASLLAIGSVGTFLRQPTFQVFVRGAAICGPLLCAIVWGGSFLWLAWRRRKRGGRLSVIALALTSWLCVPVIAYSILSLAIFP